MRELASAPEVVRFGVFELDLATRELRKKGVKLRLQDQPCRCSRCSWSDPVRS